MSGLRYLPIRSHLAIGIAALVYKQIGIKIIKNNINWNGERIYLTTVEKFFISIKILLKRLQTKPRINQFNQTSPY